MTDIIYRAYSPSTGKSYVGHTRSSMSRRISLHRSKARSGCTCLFHTAMREIVDFEFEILEEVSPDVAADRELFWMREYNSIDPYGYNTTSFVNGGKPTRRVRDLRTGKIYSSMKEAGRETGYAPDTIRKRCIGQLRPSLSYVQFEFVD